MATLYSAPRLSVSLLASACVRARLPPPLCTYTQASAAARACVRAHANVGPRHRVRSPCRLPWAGSHTTTGAYAPLAGESKSEREREAAELATPCLARPALSSAARAAEPLRTKEGYTRRGEESRGVAKSLFRGGGGVAGWFYIIHECRARESVRARRSPQGQIRSCQPSWRACSLRTPRCRSELERDAPGPARLAGRDASNCGRRRPSPASYIRARARARKTARSFKSTGYICSWPAVALAGAPLGPRARAINARACERHGIPKR